MSVFGLIAIGRNEGDRLRRCLASVADGSTILIYVDSGSTDGSVELARSFGASVVQLDTSVPFSAARARNAGLARLLSIAPDVRYVQFVDGDCEIVDGWLRQAVEVLEERADLAVVCGRRRELRPDASIYNRLMDIEWETPVGEAEACGGDAMMRVTALRQVGSYDESVVAGEEPELCQRLKQAGWGVWRLDTEMTIHDAAMDRLGQWWRRQIRSGYGAMDVVTRFGIDCFRVEVRSSRVWTIGWLTGTAGLASIGLVIGGGWATVAGIAGGIGIWGLQSIKLGRWLRSRGCPHPQAMHGGLLMMFGKWAQLLGQWRYWSDRRTGRLTRMIDYKSSDPAEHPGTAVN